MGSSGQHNRPWPRSTRFRQLRQAFFQLGSDGPHKPPGPPALGWFRSPYKLRRLALSWQRQSSGLLGRQWLLPASAALRAFLRSRLVSSSFVFRAQPLLSGSQPQLLGAGPLLLFSGTEPQLFCSQPFLLSSSTEPQLLSPQPLLLSPQPFLLSSQPLLLCS